MRSTEKAAGYHEKKAYYRILEEKVLTALIITGITAYVILTYVLINIKLEATRCPSCGYCYFCKGFLTGANQCIGIIHSQFTPCKR